MRVCKYILLFSATLQLLLRKQHLFIIIPLFRDYAAIPRNHEICPFSFKSPILKTWETALCTLLDIPWGGGAENDGHENDGP